MNKTALITGASAGIGLELSKIFAANRYDLVLVARNEEKLRTIAGELEERNQVNVRVVPKDLCQPGAPQELYDDLVAEGIAIEVLVNNAGFGLNGKFTDFRADQHENLIQLNITSLTVLCNLFGKDMVNRRSGGILNVASTAAFQAGPFMSSYYASKAYVLLLSEALNCEFAQDGVNVTVLCPGPTQTEFFVRNDMVNTNIAKSPFIMTAAQVAQVGFDGYLKKKKIIIPGTINRLLALCVRLTPRSVLTLITRYLNQQ